MGRWDRRHLWRLTQFLHKNWRALSDDDDVGNKLPVLSLWRVRLLILLNICRAVLCSKVKASRFPLPLLYHLVTKFFYKLPTFSSAWANVRPENKSPSAFAEMTSFANYKRKLEERHKSSVFLFRVMLGGSCVFSTGQPFMKKCLLQFEQAECRAVAGQSSCKSLLWKCKGISWLQARIR